MAGFAPICWEKHLEFGPPLRCSRFGEKRGVKVRKTDVFHVVPQDSESSGVSECVNRTAQLWEML